jgi:RimJ/RimL family protein N-acetyltransferase
LVSFKADVPVRSLRKSRGGFECIGDCSVLVEPSSYSAVEKLRNGERIEIRALKPQDRDDLIAAVSRTTSESLYRRFFAVRRHFSETEESFYLNIDFVSHVALVALADENGHQSIVGGARYVVGEPGQAEVAFTVVDKYQGRGLGAALLRHLAMIARHAGLRELVAYVLPDNRAMLKVFEKSGLKYTTKREAGSVYVTLGLN